MKVLGFVQRFGVGVQTAQSELQENKNKPAEFTHELTTTLCKVWCRPEEQAETERHQVGTKSAPSRH